MILLDLYSLPQHIYADTSYRYHYDGWGDGWYASDSGEGEKCRYDIFCSR